MEIAVITNLRAPYRSLQLNEFAKISNVNINVYYTHKPTDNRKWEIHNNLNFKENNLRGIKLSDTYGYINIGLLKVVKESRLVILGGYEQPTMLVLSLFCRIFKTPYIILFDGISTNKINDQSNRIKKFLKSLVIKNASFIMGNGVVSREYFSKSYNYPINKIYNQYLTVDTSLINQLYPDRQYYREELRKKLNIDANQKVLIYSGRLIDIKNVDIILYAISQMEVKYQKEITVLIIGDGYLKQQLCELSKKLGINVLFTNFIHSQKELFKHYFIGDLLVLPSIEEAWGLVVNEAMCAGLPVIVSDICGSSLDLVDGNGYTFNPQDSKKLAYYIQKVLFDDNYEKLSEKSREIISSWTHENSKYNLETILFELK